MTMNSEAHAQMARSEAACVDQIRTLMPDGGGEDGQQLHASLATYHATMAVYGLLSDVVEGFRALGVIR